MSSGVYRFMTLWPSGFRCVGMCRGHCVRSYGGWSFIVLSCCLGKLQNVQRFLELGVRCCMGSSCLHGLEELSDYG